MSASTGFCRKNEKIAIAVLTIGLPSCWISEEDVGDLQPASD
jgi:hypothetical protein